MRWSVRAMEKHLRDTAKRSTSQPRTKPQRSIRRLVDPSQCHRPSGRTKTMEIQVQATRLSLTDFGDSQDWNYGQHKKNMIPTHFASVCAGGDPRTSIGSPHNCFAAPLLTFVRDVFCWPFAKSSPPQNEPKQCSSVKGIRRVYASLTSETVKTSELLRHCCCWRGPSHINRAPAQLPFFRCDDRTWYVMP